MKCVNYYFFSIDYLLNKNHFKGDIQFKLFRMGNFFLSWNFGSTKLTWNSCVNVFFFSNVDKILKYICCQYKDRQVCKWVQNFNLLVLVRVFQIHLLLHKKIPFSFKSFDRLLPNLRWRWNSYQQQFEIEILNMHPHFKGKKANLQQANRRKLFS